MTATSGRTTRLPATTEDPAAERDVEALTPAELDTVAAEVLEHYRVAVYILAWMSLRFGELIELRRKDIVDDGGVMKFRVRRGAARVGEKIVVGATKTVRSKRWTTADPESSSPGAPLAPCAS